MSPPIGSVTCVGLAVVVTIAFCGSSTITGTVVGLTVVAAIAFCGSSTITGTVVGLAVGLVVLAVTGDSNGDDVSGGCRVGLTVVIEVGAIVGILVVKFATSSELILP